MNVSTIPWRNHELSIPFGRDNDYVGFCLSLLAVIGYVGIRFFVDLCKEYTLKNFEES
jgi:hypothetical protein